jgi:hypothetical protein
MAKMFYSLEEAAQKLGMDVDDVKALTESGQLQEFRDQDKIMLKVEQVDLLAGDNDDSGGMIPLADSGEIEPISMSSSGSAPAMDGDPDQTGVSIFDPEDEDDADPAAATQVSPTMGGFDFGDAAASGSGLANLALEGDDTSLGADLLEDVYSSTGSGSMAAASSGVGGSAMASGIMDADGDLFESAGTTPEPIGAAPAMAGAGAMMPEAYDGGGSGLVGGVAIGIVVTMLLAAAAMILMLDGNAQLMDQMSMNFVYMTVGIGAGVMVLGGLIGWFLLRKS